MQSRTERPGCLALILNLFRRSPSRQPAIPVLPQKSLEISPEEPMPYRLRDDFLSPAELSYFMVLRSVLGPRATICTKVRLADLLFVARPHENMSFVNRISSKHVDFLICEASSMRPVVAIELDDASHDRDDRRLRDAFVDDALEAAGLPLVRVIPRSQYSYEEVVAQLRPILMAALPSPPEAKSPPKQATTAAETPTCPKCGIPMVLRTAAKGNRKGSQFYGCPNFPRCREVVPISTAISAG